MKNMIPLKMILPFLILGGGVLAQTTIQSPNIPVAGDVWGNKTITDTTIQPGAGGTNQVWNFSSYFVNPSVISEVFTVPTGSGNDALYPTSNLKATSVFGGDDYYYRTNTQLQYMGFKNQSMEIVISNAQKVIDVPMQYGDSLVNIPVSGTGIFGYPLSGNVSVKADGTGNLTLYTGSFVNTLRLVTTMNLVVGAGSGNDTYVDLVKYTWYSPLYRAPIFQIATVNIYGNLASVKNKVVTVSLLTSDVASIKNDFDFYLSPNPAQSSTRVSFDLSGSASEIRVMDLAGKIHRQMNIEAGVNETELDLSGLSKGIYMVSISQDDKISRQQLVIN